MLTAAHILIGPHRTPLTAASREQLNGQIRQTDRKFDNQKYAGATGLIDFDTRGVATGRRLTLLCAPDISRAFDSAARVPYEVDRGWRDRDREKADLAVYRTTPSPPRRCDTRPG